MSNIRFIKDIYAPKEAQEDLRYDGMYLHAKNMVANFIRYTDRKMTKKEVDIYIKFMYDRLIAENGIEKNWDQTA